MPTGLSPAGAPNIGGVGYVCEFWPVSRCLRNGAR